MNAGLKIGIVAGLGFVTYKLYKLWQMSNLIKYTPVDYKYEGGFINVKMRLDNPTNTTLSMRGLKGYIQTADGNIIATYGSGPFEINAGQSFFNIAFKIDNVNAIMEALNSLLVKGTPDFSIVLTKMLPKGINISETFNIKANTFA